jgi:hypothetical protein
MTHRLLLALLAVAVAFGPSASSAVQLTLTWTDNAAGRAGFVVERAVTSAGPFAYLGTNPPGVTGYYDTTVLTGQTYCYRVAAVDDSGQSAYSNVACGLVPTPPPQAFRVTVTKLGTGMGTITSSPGGISCGTQCSAQYARDSVVVLTATPHPNSRFSGWSGGGCSGTSLCRVTVTAPVTITATFTKGHK